MNISDTLISAINELLKVDEAFGMKITSATSHTAAESSFPGGNHTFPKSVSEEPSLNNVHDHAYASSSSENREKLNSAHHFLMRYAKRKGDYTPSGDKIKGSEEHQTEVSHYEHGGHQFLAKYRPGEKRTMSISSTHAGMDHLNSKSSTL